MSLVVEDGSVVAGANSWVTRAEVITYAAARGITLADDVTTDRLAIDAQEFISAHEPNLIGDRVSREQTTAYPRSNLYIQGFEWDDDEIPRQVILCQLAYTLELSQGIDIYNPDPIRTRKKEKIDGAVEVEYFGTDTSFKLSRDSKASALLASLLNRSGLFSVTLERR